MIFDGIIRKLYFKIIVFKFWNLNKIILNLNDPILIQNIIDFIN